MSRPDVTILVVDDARFSNTVIGKTIRSGGYTNIRHANSASEALSLMEEAPADILIADWQMPEMDGLQLAHKVRQIDETTHHYTYIILLTAKEGNEALSEAFEEGIDDFVNKSEMNTQLLPRLSAAQRSADNHNRLLRENQRLIQLNQKLNNLSTVDSLTGLGNLRYATRKLRDTIKHADSRDGAACYFLIRLENFAELEARYSRTITDQMAIGIARRLRQLVRPLDTITRNANHEFALIIHMDDSAYCSANGFRRFYDDLNKEFKTGAGFMPAKAAIGAAWADRKTGFPDDPARMMAQAQTLAAQSASFNKLVMAPYACSGLTETQVHTANQPRQP